MNRRQFLAALPVLVGGSTRTYFDIGASWEQHEQIWYPKFYAVITEIDRTELMDAYRYVVATEGEAMQWQRQQPLEVLIEK